MEKPANEKRLQILDSPPAVRDLVRECELTGQRTVFERYGRPVAILVSHDEYLALRETIEIAGDPDLRAMLDATEAEIRRNALLLPEDLFGE
jgi:PHD/YefM family antitoxin component YafN of YafNO toxin-antitoxin module